MVRQVDSIQFKLILDYIFRYHDGREIKSDRRITIEEISDTIFRLTVADVKASDAGQYGVRIVNNKTELMSTCNAKIEGVILNKKFTHCNSVRFTNFRST